MTYDIRHWKCGSHIMQGSPQAMIRDSVCLFDHIPPESLSPPFPHSYLKSLYHCIKIILNQLRHHRLHSPFSSVSSHPSIHRQEIGRAFRKASLKLHPDKLLSCGLEESSAAEEAFAALREAYDTLSDPVARDRYDKRDAWRMLGLGRAWGAWGELGGSLGMVDVPCQMVIFKWGQFTRHVVLWEMRGYERYLLG